MLCFASLCVQSTDYTTQDLACGTSDRMVAYASVTELMENPAVRRDCLHRGAATELMPSLTDSCNREVACGDPVRAAL